MRCRSCSSSWPGRSSSGRSRSGSGPPTASGWWAMAADGALARPERARPVRRLLRLWGAYARMDLLFIARGAKLALSFYVADVVIGASSSATTFLLAERFGTIGPWTRPAILFMLGYGL